MQNPNHWLMGNVAYIFTLACQPCNSANTLILVPVHKISLDLPRVASQLLKNEICCSMISRLVAWRQ